MKFLLVFIVPLVMGQGVFADVAIDKNREKLLGKILKQMLEQHHYKKMKIDDIVSKKAFKEFLKNIDYGKQFLTKQDIKKLRKFELTMDDEMVSGNHAFLAEVTNIFSQRVKEAEQYRVEIFKKQFNFDTKESLELDPDKRDWANSSVELKERWRKLFKYYTLNNYLSLVDAEKTPKKKDSSKDKKEKKEKKLTKKEKMVEAHNAISKKHEDFFKKLLKGERIDYLEKFFNAIATIFDPHSNYLPPQKKEDFDIDISGQLEGIGAVLQEDGPHIKVVNIVPGGAAWRQKDLEIDDVILAVSEGSDGKVISIVNMSVNDAVRYIRGKKNTEVRLTVKKADGTRKVISIIRDIVQVGATYVKSSVIKHKKLDVKIGYIYLPKFYRDFSGGPNCTDDVRMELRRLKKQKVDAIVLDLRNNGGGALEDAKLMSGLFIKTGPIVQVKNHNQKVEVLADTDSSIEYPGPLVIMVNRFSASASEILAGAMIDYKRAVVVGGEFTHGKGTVQVVQGINPGPLFAFLNNSLGALKVTIQKFYRINGISTQYKGITSNIILPDPLGHLKSREQDLEYSLKWDQITPLRYRSWDRFSFDLAELKTKSQKRIEKNENMKKIIESVEFLKKRRNETRVSLSLQETVKKDEENKKLTGKYKINYVDKNLEVSHYEPSLRAHENIRKEDEKKWRKDFKKRKKEWVDGLQKDVLLGEVFYIARDHVHQIRRATLGRR